MWIRFSACFGAYLLLVSVCAAQVRTSAAFIEEGKRELENGRFTAAADSFRKAAELDSNSPIAYILLTRALVGQVQYNLRLLPDVSRVLPEAERAAKKAVDLAPTDPSAWCVLGIVDHKLADAARDPDNIASELNAADQAFKKALSIDARLFEAHYELGSMASAAAAMPLIAAAHQSGVPAGRPPRIQDPNLLKRMQDRYGLQINIGIEHTRQALTIDPKSWKAMHQMAGLMNELSLLEDREEKSKADHDLATDWENKAEAARPKVPSNPPTPEQLAVADAFAGTMSGPSLLPPGQSSGTMLVVLPEQAEKSVVKKVDPVYPDAAKQAGIAGAVRFRIWVNKEGRVKNVELLSGDSRLVNSARDAVWKWEFKPLVVNREPREFMTVVALQFER